MSNYTYDAEVDIARDIGRTPFGITITSSDSEHDFVTIQERHILKLVWYIIVNYLKLKYRKL